MRSENQSPKFQTRNAEVQQEANRHTSRLEVVQDLGLMDRPARTEHSTQQ